MKKKLLALALLTLLCLSSVITLAACEREVIRSFEYTETSFTYLEKEYEAFQTVMYDGYTVSTENANYYLSDDLSEHQRNRFVTFSEAALEYFSEYQDEEGTVEIFVSTDFYTHTETQPKGGYFPTIWYNYNDVKSIRHIHFILQALTSEYVNYGLLYGISARAYKEMGWGKVSTKSNSQIKSYLEDLGFNYVLDLTYPLFSERFYTKSQIAYAESISVKIVQHIDKNYGREVYEELFEASNNFTSEFDTLFYGYINEWIQPMKLMEKYVQPVTFRAASYTRDFPIIISTASCDYMLSRDWEEKIVNVTMRSYFDVDKNYPKLYLIYMQLESAYQSIREFIGDESGIRITMRQMNSETDIPATIQSVNTAKVYSLSTIVQAYASLRCESKYGPNPYSTYILFSEYVNDRFNDAIINDLEFGYLYRNSSNVHQTVKDYYNNNFGDVYDMYYELFDGNYGKYDSVIPSELIYEDFLYCFVYNMLTKEDLSDNMEMYAYYYEVAKTFYMIREYGKEAYFVYYANLDGYEIAYGIPRATLEQNFVQFVTEYIDNHQYSEAAASRR